MSYYIILKVFENKNIKQSYYSKIDFKGNSIWVKDLFNEINWKKSVINKQYMEEDIENYIHQLSCFVVIIVLRLNLSWNGWETSSQLEGKKIVQNRLTLKKCSVSLFKGILWIIYKLSSNDEAK